MTQEIPADQIKGDSKWFLKRKEQSQVIKEQKKQLEMIFAQQQAMMAGVHDPQQLLAMQQAMMMNGGRMQADLLAQAQFQA